MPTARAVDPPPDGGYNGQNTAEGEDALFSLTTGTDNTAIGFNTLLNNTTGGSNTAIGASALFSNSEGGSNTGTGGGALYSNTTGSFNTATGGGRSIAIQLVTPTQPVALAHWDSTQLDIGIPLKASIRFTLIISVVTTPLPEIRLCILI